jgi:hypothetical protein
MGSVERRHRHIVETGLTLLATAHVPLTLLDAAFETATYLINSLPSKVTHNKSPFQLLTIHSSRPLVVNAGPSFDHTTNRS